MADFSSIGGTPVQDGKLDFSSVENSSQSDVGEAIKNAVMDIIKKPASAVKDLGTNPETMANAMPAVLGTAGGTMVPIPGAGTAGTVIGQGIRDLTLKGLGKPIPSGTQHGIEIGGSVLGDLTAFPSINKARIGGEIGNVERMAGVPPAQEIPSLPKPKAGDPVSGGIDEAIKSVSEAKASGGGIPTYWKQIKDQIDSFYDLGKDVKLTALDKGKLKWLNAQVQQGLNNAVPGRAPLAADLARSQFAPNLISSGYQAIPKPIKTLVGLGAAGTLADALARRIAK